MSDPQAQKSCIVCSMPLVKTEDYPEGDPSKDYCKYCGTKDGLRTYNELVAGMTQFMMKTQGMEESQAKIAAKQTVDNSVAVKSGRLKA
jgi:hypothetical protein